jgi:hypothetical protein
MKPFVSHAVTHIVLVVVLFGSGAVAAAADSADVPDTFTLSASFQEPSGLTGTFEVTVDCEESAPVPASPAYPAGASEATPIPEPSTLLLLGLGVLGLIALRKRWETRRSR